MSAPAPVAEKRSRKPGDRKDHVSKQPVLQVDCYVSPASAERQDVEKSLNREKIVRHVRNAYRARSDANLAAADRDAEKNHSPTAGGMIRIFDCEATPAQIEATLTSLAGRPDTLAAVAVHPGVNIGGQPPQDSLVGQFRQAPQKAEEEPSQPYAARSASSLHESARLRKAGAGLSGESSSLRQNVKAAQPITLGGSQTPNAVPADPSRKSSLQVGQTVRQAMAEMAKWTDREQTYRVVFVVHVLGSEATEQVPQPAKPAASAGAKP